MNTFRTEIKLADYPNKIHYEEAILCLGSCFATHMSSKLLTHKFESLLNPFGILFNPYSIAKAIQWLCVGADYKKEDLFFHDGLWHSFDHHGIFSHPDPEQGLQQINSSLEKGRAFLLKSKWCVLTLGTAYVFQKKSDQKIVANCHKLPGSQFDRIKLSLDEVVQEMKIAIQNIRKQNPSIRFILTVSPVRHIRDGLVENQRSKATLLLATEQLVKELKEVYYFPAYELLLDDLRDYRFYEADMIHPNQQAIDYIWKRFSGAFFGEKERLLMKEVHKLVLSAQHRPLHPDREVHQKFVHAQLKKMDELERKYAFLDFGRERGGCVRVYAEIISKTD